MDKFKDQLDAAEKVKKHISFGSTEDNFYLATRYARERCLPRIYLSANPGARLGLAEKAINLFSIAWNVPDAPEKGSKYLCLTRENWLKLQKKAEGSTRVGDTEEDDYLSPRVVVDPDEDPMALGKGEICSL